MSSPERFRALLVPFILATGLLLSLASTVRPQTQRPLRLIVHETPLGSPRSDVRFDYSFVVSPDHQRVAYVDKRGTKEVLVVDGVAGQPHAAILRTPTTEAGIGRPLIFFSPDSRHVAFEARDAGGTIVVWDGIEGKPYEDIGELRFSDDSKHLLYTAKRGGRTYTIMDAAERAEVNQDVSRRASSSYALDPRTERRGDKVVAIVNGVEGRPYDAIGDTLHTIVLSPDHRHFIYRASVGGRSFIVADGVEDQRYDAIAEDSYRIGDDGRAAYVGVRADKSFVVYGQEERGPYDRVFGAFFKGPELSPDGQRSAYVVMRGEELSTVIDGADKGAYCGFFPVFSPDSKRVMYGVKRDGGCFLVLDRAEGPYDEIGYGALFSPDSRRAAYKVRRGGRWMVVVDGVEGPADGAVSSLIFSQDSRHFAYRGSRATGLFVVLDGRESGPYDEVFPDPRFTQGGGHVFFAVRRDEKSFLVVDGTSGDLYDQIVTGGPNNGPANPLFSVGAQKLSFVARRGTAYYLVKVEIAES